jgi:phosphatidylinositol glycan class O
MFVGDQIWVFLLPDSFTLAYPYDSHNVRDLDTVDQGVVKKFREHFDQDWDLMIGHMLGVDHVAHRYYANHPEMQRKLSEVNQFIEEIIEKLDDQSLFILIGDHGMTDEGNHGGATLQEIQTVLFAYSKQKFVEFQPRRMKLAQIDVVPTISLLMGIPIPFNNLGTIIPEVFKNETLIEKSLFLNAQQVSRYLETYDSNVKKLPDLVFEKIQGMFLDIKNGFEIGRLDVQGIFEYIELAGKMCRGIWTTFDYGVMIRSTISVFLGTVTGVLMLIYTNGVIENKSLLFSLILSPISTSLSFLYLLYQTNKHQISRNLNESFKISLLINTLFGYTLFSDSYIVKQDQVMRFLCQLLLFSSFHQSYSHSLLISSLCIRLSSTFDIFTQTSNPGILYSPIIVTVLPMFFLFSLHSNLFYRSNLLLTLLYWTVPALHVQLLPKSVYLVFLLSLLTQRSKLNILPVLLILSGPQSPILAVLALIQVTSAAKVLKNDEIFATFLALSAGQYFYASGHRCNIQSLRISSAFIGFDEYIFWINGVLLSLNTLSGYFLMLVCRTERQVKYFMIHFLVAACCTLLNTFVNGRHLMVWSVFAPKFIFDGIVFVVVWTTGLIMLFFNRESFGKQAE